MNRAVWVLAVVVVAGCTTTNAPGSGVASSENGLTAKTLPGGDKPLELSLKRYGGVPFSLTEERGHVVLIDVWASWCDPCRQSLPLYQAMNERLKDKGFRVYAVSVDADLSAIPKFIKETELKLPVLLDPSAGYAEGTLKVTMMPTAFLIDRTGRVRFVHEGFTDVALTEVNRQVDSLLAEQ